MFETETMAELCVSQGLLRKAITIYRRLAAGAPDEITRARRRQRMAELEQQAAVSQKAAAIVQPTATLAKARATLPVPGVRAIWDSRHTTIEWRLPTGTTGPAVELLLVLRTPAGIQTERRTMRVDDSAGRLVLAVPDLHSVHAAAGRMDGERFVPIVRADSDPPR